MMDKKELHEMLLKHVCKEIEQISEQIQKSQSLSSSNLEMLDKLYHLKKSMLTCKAMEDAEEGGEEEWSGRRGRAANGRYVSRNMGNMQQSFADGYAQGYSEAMNQGGNSGTYNEGYANGYSEAMNQAQGGNSGHAPMMPYPQRRW